MNFIDAHSHVWTPDTERYPLVAGYFRDRMQPRSYTAEELLKMAEPVGVNRVVLIQMSFYGYNNSYMLENKSRFENCCLGSEELYEWTTVKQRVYRERESETIKSPLKERRFKKQ